MVRYIFVTGGVLSSLGKGLASASIAAVLQARGYKIQLRKFDPYLNVDPGTMNPSQHGEVFVTEDGAETDLDLGHYERFTGVNGKKSDAITTGKVYSDVIARERRGDYLGATVMVVPHIIDRIKEYIREDLREDLDFLICEIGGTVGDIEGLPYLEAIRQFRIEQGSQAVMFIHLTLVPYVPTSLELKTKPTQHSVKELLSAGIQPDLLLCRCDRPIPEEAHRKLALFCNLKPSRVFEARDVSSIYEVPLCYAQQGVDAEILSYFGLEAPLPDLTKWKKIVNHIYHPHREVNIAIVGKYMDLYDAYKSVYEALTHGGLPKAIKVNFHRLSSEVFEEGGEKAPLPFSQEKIAEQLKTMQGVVVPGGYGARGTTGIMAVIRYCREKKLPFLGICYGMQLAVVEFANHVLGLTEATSTEINPSTPDPVVGLLTEWKQGDVLEMRTECSEKGGTMRLGTFPCHLSEGSLAHRIYGTDVVHERHRHRYEINTSYRKSFEARGLLFSGISEDHGLPTIMELEDHPWFLGVQFHPELTSRPFAPSPVFRAFVEAVSDLSLSA